jgi:hypothetical protein
MSKLGGNMPLSASQIAPNESANDTSRHWHTSVSQNTSAVRRHFAPLTIEEKTTYRKWRQATLIFYGAFACVIAAFLVIAGPTDPSTNAGDKDSYSTLASVGQRNPR